MAQYRNSRQIGYTAWSNGAWSSFMNSYAATPLNTGATSGIRGVIFNGSTNVTAPWSGTYTFRVAADDFGSANMGGNGISVGGFTSGGNTTSRYFNKGDNISLSWSIGNSGGANGDDFNSNPCAVAWTLDGPDAPPFPSVSLSASPTTIIRGESVSFSWSGSGVGLYSASLTDVSNPGYSGSTTLLPQNTKTYTYTVCGERGCSSASRTITVYIPPVITLSFNKTSIIAGETARLSWNTSGDGDVIYWTKGDVTNGNVTSFSDVSPGDTTEYCAYVTGNGGTSPISCATITVYQIPTIDKFNVPLELIYGQQGIIEYEAKYANNSVTIQTIYNYKNGSVDKGTISYPTSGSAELSGTNTIVTNSVNTEIEYDNFGPRSVTYVLTVSGNGGQLTMSETVNIIIDETPDNLNVDETGDRIKDEDPVYTINVPPEELVLSDLYYIDGIDIPIEIKSDFPIQVEINKSGDWKNIREM